MFNYNNIQVIKFISIIKTIFNLMKPNTFLQYLLVFYAYFFCIQGNVIFSQNSKKIVVKNELAIDRMDEPVILKRSQLIKILNWTDSEIPVVLNSSSTIVPQQFDDINGDEIWDEIYFLVDIKSKDSLIYEIKTMDKRKLPDFQFRTNVHFAAKPQNENDKYVELKFAKRLNTNESNVSQKNFQFEGPGWENDKVAFRNYFDLRNGIDIFGKKTNAMVLEKAGYKGQNYHELSDWGMDILKVGNSLGAGALAIATKDTIIRVGSSGTGTYKLITQGPLRSELLFEYDSIEIGKRIVKMSWYISISAGTRCYESQVFTKGLNENEFIISGIVNKHSDSLIALNQYNYVILATHGNQTESAKGEKLGMAIITENSNFLDFGETPKSGNGITETYFCMFKKNTGIRYYFFSCWEYEYSNFAKSEAFVNEMKEFSLKKSSPLLVKF